MPTTNHLRPETLTIAEAASTLGRSRSWVRDQITLGWLERLDVPGSRQMHVTKRSVQRIAPWARQKAAPRPHLYLIVDNT
ncbi:hypothetical protein [Phreatobacter oligotrophus]|uniref:hypothetical protein n=1 Tax=Phreatobacter oligotrophus TaxID=1122261 RepID=UPI000D3A9826|nr:hypothetical protein [Phreatobacter oligotrophus]